MVQEEIAGIRGPFASFVVQEFRPGVEIAAADYSGCVSLPI
jgi:hypothetical protein